MPDALVSTDWLQTHLDAPDVRVVDATWFLPGVERDARAEYAAGHIEGAVFFDLDAVCEPKNLHPHTVPSAAKFSSRVRKLGLGDGNRIVIYDGNRFFASARVWWMFRFMGHGDVMVLDPCWCGQRLHAGRRPGLQAWSGTCAPGCVRHQTR